MPLNPVGKIYYAGDYNETSLAKVCFDLLVGVQLPLEEVVSMFMGIVLRTFPSRSGLSTFGNIYKKNIFSP